MRLKNKRTSPNYLTGMRSENREEQTERRGAWISNENEEGLSVSTNFPSRIFFNIEYPLDLSLRARASSTCVLEDITSATAQTMRLADSPSYMSENIIQKNYTKEIMPTGTESVCIAADKLSVT